MPAATVAAAPTTDEARAITALQREVLEAVALDMALPETMRLLCQRVEALAPGVICTVLSVDAEGLVHPLAAPSMPDGFSHAIDGQPIGPRAGSCGTAAWRRQPVQVSDIEADPLWDDYRELARGFGLAACWSNPIFMADGSVGATFALYYREKRPVADIHRHMVEACVHLCMVALRHDKHQRQIERLAYYDSLTGLANRSLFNDRAHQALQMAIRLGMPGALLLLDIDRFKTINDTLGHAAGDTVLKVAAERLGRQLREVDTLARLGGDEFVLMLPGCAAADAMAIAAKLHAALAEPLLLDPHELHVTASIGIARFPDDGRVLDVVLKNADIAMYAAKQAGRHCTRYFLPTMNQALDERMRIESLLRQALEAGRLQLHYQPKLALEDGPRRLLGVEALLRWNDPELGEVGPNRFIPVAEECGLIGAIDAWVLDTACAQLAQWRKRGLAVPNVAVNASAPRFGQDDIAGQLAQLCRRHGLQPQDLTLEITESLMLEPSRRADQQLQALDAMGVRLSVDDFGTGYSSLAYLKRLPVCELKLDRSFVRELETDADDRALAAAVIAIGQALGLSTVAEGVETEGQRRFLLEAGCTAAQGYGLARPMDAAAFERWLLNEPASGA
ncbi:bifunctional diguanylate cyclase/phosphodiesterase, partial [Pelomonas sp. KK5]|uniref:putative bifunctional diguanylate cyclase/phosphodiesterase n=1 Tax=Pelomonas sp. KK5 TaxID=1855730 RepID=UPI001301EF1B